MRSAIGNLILLILCLLPLVAGCGPAPSSEADSAAPQAVIEKSTSVKVIKVVAQDLEERFTLPGSLEAWEDLTLAAEIAGPVDWVGPHEGEVLKRGQKILTIDSVSQKANLERDQVDAKVKQKTMERLASLGSYPSSRRT